MRLDDVPVPQDARPGQALIRVLACGICGTDVEEWRSGPVFIPTQPHPLTGRQAPITLGHEVVGIVEALGVREDHIEIGDVVAVDGLSGCGECRWCREDRIVLCEQLAAIGLMSDGGLAEYCVVPARGCFRLPPEIDSGSAALTETLAVGVRALRRGRLAAGERVVVTGAGAAGLLAAQAARALGASDVTIVEPERMRRGVAASLGLNAVEDAAEAPLGDVVVECSGAPAAIPLALDRTVRGGRLVLVGICPETASISPLDIVTGEREILGSLSHHWGTDFAAAVELLADGSVQAEPIVTHRIPLAHALDHGLTALAEDPGKYLKIVVQPERIE